ncbi:MAG TPA: S-layer homology domain-containing protein, partial [Anaerovoracaceae bacterium]|nr:S-layer homology domain-containing protein [Anaerovoracaceae bacterium]
MKRIITFVLVICFLFTATLTYAIIPDNMCASGPQIVTDGINNAAEEQAKMLKTLGLFIGTDNGFELDRHLTRIEAAALIVRFMGAEKNALTQNNKHPFKDVPQWADPYVGWLYQNKITYGISVTLFGSSQNVTYWQFATFLSRISTGSDEFIPAGIGTEEEQEFIDRENQDQPGTDFSRADAVSMLTRFMRCIYIKEPAGQMTTMAQFLVKRGVFTSEQFVKAGINIYPITYTPTDNNGLSAQLENISFAKSTLTGIYADTSYPPSQKEYFYALKHEDDIVLLYRMDCLTLEETLVAQWAQKDICKPWKISYLGTVMGKDVLGLWYNNSVSLIVTDGAKTEKIAQGKDFGIDSKQYWGPYIQSGDELVVVIDDTVYIFGPNGLTFQNLGENAKLVGVENGLAILCTKENGYAIIDGIRLDNWTITDSYRIPLPEADTELGWLYLNGRPLLRQHWGGPYDDKEAGIYGEAGLFVVQDGHLDRVTERPVIDVAFLRIGASGAYAILSHDPKNPTGNTIYQYNGSCITGRDGYDEIERLGNDPPHGIAINGIQGTDSMVFFSSKAGVGMDHYDVFTYYPSYNSAKGHMGIAVMNFAAGRPEISFAEHDAQWYVQKEQE